jgi:hypothetical protein
VPFLCCTSDFTGDDLLGVEDYRLYFLWDSLVDKGKPEEEQKQDLETYYAAAYPGDPAAAVTELPVLDCGDYAGNLGLGVEDYRLYFLWDTLVNHTKPEPEQLADLEVFYTAAYPDDPSVTPVRIPALLTPAECSSLHGWFVTPWQSTVEIGAAAYGWFE